MLNRARQVINDRLEVVRGAGNDVMGNVVQIGEPHFLITNAEKNKELAFITERGQLEGVNEELLYQMQTDLSTFVLSVKLKK